MQQEEQRIITIHGAVHHVRDMGEFAFVILRQQEGLTQCVLEPGQAISKETLHGLKEEMTVEVTGAQREEPRAPGGYEIQIQEISILSAPAEPMPVAIYKKKLPLSVESNLNYRPLTLRNQGERSLFKLQEGVVRGFRDYLYTQGFTEVHTPKIVHAGAEGGANIFKLDYFGQKAYLAQSPQFYKQMMVGVFERVFEVGPVFRAEKHNTTRHLNEYTSLDFEMGYIKSFEDIMDMEEAMLKHVMDLLAQQYSGPLKELGVILPVIRSIPRVRFSEAKDMVAKRYDRKIKDPYDLEPEEEQLIGQLFLEEQGSDFVFVTHYPTKKRPFYAMEDPENTKFTLSFDLLFRGMEVTTGGQRIHDYNDQVAKMLRKGMDPAGFESYLMIHKHGMPPHGGLGIGLERFCMKLAGLQNVKLATLFPRDQSRLEP